MKNSLCIGEIVRYNDGVWQVFDFGPDDNGYLTIRLIDPNFDATSGKPDPTKIVHDLSAFANRLQQRAIGAANQ